ncbi:MAG: SDR family NAD(P)-dependent oxidoreductase [Gammaproteobacteria bacterium]|jgi:NAD(P)-dependent dehydrogenase (short-subunit alcohol dehydrogenase family)|nr:SDR family NAD(P)-dependent oxidoreductase [Gammaproteobacteria bacterium]MBP6053159.1 SDR family NAD(P)-dependent oxidoreductase [Pseudomonadales bacterium]MBK6584538.1 SDR family NAD(P)-dependent oxidoreductase [Gammaproteobacteria bacterium]MBK7519958.1 SDR family NAD(P)-dependent oxidoreductase [Gammaproteobacteria bacterium]MBK7730779.1 SDR family NAD(P)-dependent oxidoreductase [Gammaproteobacteria bacterium]
MGVLDGKIAVVAGGSRGVGRGCVLELAAAGAKVYILGRTLTEGDSAFPGSLSKTVSEAADLGGHAVPIVCDLRSDAQIEAVFARVIAEDGQIDVLVNSAFDLPEGCGNGERFFETPISFFDDMMAVSARSVYVTTWHAAQHMIPRRKGLVVNISSQGSREFFVHATYGVSKAALDRIGQDAGRELAAQGVALVTLWPSFVLTERILSLDADEWELDLTDAESPRFPGRGVVALAADPDVVTRSGRIYTTRQMAEAYGFTDLDGRLPKGAPDPLTHYPLND